MSLNGKVSLRHFLTLGMLMYGTTCRAEEIVPIEQCSDLLRFLAAQNESNYRKIETWKGTYRFRDRFPYRAFDKTGSRDSNGSQNNTDEVQGLLTREGTVRGYPKSPFRRQVDS